MATYTFLMKNEYELIICISVAKEVMRKQELVIWLNNNAYEVNSNEGRNLT